MKIALIGYGKMGKAIENVALSRGHEVVLKIDEPDSESWNRIGEADVAIEFTTPHTAVANIKKCLDAGTPVVVGSTGWYSDFEEVKKLCAEKSGSVFTATNFSIGVNIFFAINRKLAGIMNKYPQYDVTMEEIHHLQKLDSPSGTAITIAEQILSEVGRKNAWVEYHGSEIPATASASDLMIQAKREENVPGTHTVFYTSSVDTIEIKHTAHNREGFAQGAVIAAEWLPGKKGCFGMDDLMKDQF